MMLVKVGRKWRLEAEPPEQGWVFNRLFPTKWKAEIAKNVFLEGGKPKDYWKKSEEYSLNHPQKEPSKAIKIVTEAFDEINKLNPTAEEIEEFGTMVGHGTATITPSTAYFPPKLHNTWGKKSGGRVHIDIGSGGYHLMLDKYAASGFIEFIKEKRELVIN